MIKKKTRRLILLFVGTEVNIFFFKDLHVGNYLKFVCLFINPLFDGRKLLA